MEKLTFPRVDEILYREVLPNGLTVFVCPKPDFQKSYAFFATNYGGIDMKFALDGNWQATPAGVAHYLEHKMFDTQEGNALQDLAQNGASPNAFTSNDITGYYFSSTEKFEENLKILLSFVSIPYFTKESVEKEQGIIGQEIGMIEDDPNWKVYMNLMEAMYQYNPVRTSIAGSVESISHITAETLYACHKAFYDPANMVLCVTGNVDPQQICAIAQEILPKEPGTIAQRDYGHEEPTTVCQHEVTIQMEVAAPLFQLGFKLVQEPKGIAGQRQEILCELALEALLGTSSPLYARLYESGMVNGSFGYGYESYPQCAFLCVGGESRDPQAVRDAILAEGQRIAREGIDQGLWSRLKKACYGNRVQGLNSFEHICISQAQEFFVGRDFLTFPEAFDLVEREDAQALIASVIQCEGVALSVVLPREEKKV